MRRIFYLILCWVAPVWAASDSHIEVKFIRGNHYHRLLLKSSSTFAEVSCYEDTQLTLQNKIRQNDYLSLHERAEALFDGLGVTNHPGRSICRTPFILTIVTPDGTKSKEGCRSMGQGQALGKLIRDAEQLTVQKK